MSIELKIPQVGESITEVEIGKWLKGQGDRVERDEPLAELESDKATVELPSPSAGVIREIRKQAGESAAIDEVIAIIDPDEGEAAEQQARPAEKTPKQRPSKQAEKDKAEQADRPKQSERTQSAGREEQADGAKRADRTEARPRTDQAEQAEPVAKRVKPEEADQGDESRPPEPPDEQAAPMVAHKAAGQGTPAAQPGPRGEEELVRMSPIRRRIAERLVEAQRTAALLTTFNEIDMGEVLELRRLLQEQFQKRYQVKLGLMSFFVKAAIDALKQFPQLNAEVRGEEIAYRNYFDIGIAISGGKGLVVPVLRNAEQMSFAEIERAINELAERARDNRIKLEELEGGTFTITNGGVFGSLLSTPIVNPPQSGVLGMHAIQERPVARDGQVAIRPMMYVALTYDHRIVDGREAVLFLRRIKEVLESPPRMLIEA